MKRSALGALALLIALVLFGAAFALTRDDTPAQLVRALRDDAGVLFAECADEACLEAALGPCTPAHLRQVMHLIEGTAVPTDWFVLQRGEGCRVVQIADYTDDTWGGCTVRQQVCPTLSAFRSNNPMRDGCSENTVLFTQKNCEPWP